jgi:hypothetical protein
MPVAPYQIRPARPTDARSIVEIFDAVYDGYPAERYRDPETLQQAIRSDDTITIFVIEVLDAESEDVERSVVGTGAVKFHSNGAIAEPARGAIAPQFQGLRRPEADQSAYQRLLVRRIRYARESEADTIRAQTDSSTHAITQRELAKHGFVPVGISKGRYPEVFPDRGRENIVIMVDTRSSFRPFGNATRSPPTIYVPEQFRPFVRHVLRTLAVEHEQSPIPRELETPGSRAEETNDDWSVIVDSTIDREVTHAAEFTLTPAPDEQGKSGSTVVRKVQRAVDEPDIERIGISFDANHPSTGALCRALLDHEFAIEAFEPDARRRGSVRDVLTLQHAPGSLTDTQLIEEALALLEQQGLPYRQVPADSSIDGVVDVRL